MKRQGKLALRYGKALFNLAKQTVPQEMPRLATELENIAVVFQDKELLNAMLSPLFLKGQRQEALLAVLDHCQVSELLKKFVMIIFDHGRITALTDIAESFRALADSWAGIVHVTVTTASDVSTEEKTVTESQLRKAISGNPVFHWSVDAGILGGIVVSYGGKVIDGSLSHRLKSIEQALLED